MRLIDADALKRAIATIMPSRVEVNLVVDDQPDAIVRCKDCKHGRRMKTENSIEVYCENNRIERIFCEQDWFCADGRKRDDT